MPERDKTELSAEIERLYEVFRPYVPPPHPTYCTHCVSDAEDAVLHTVWLKEGSLTETASL